MTKMEGLTEKGMKIMDALERLAKLEIAVGFQRGQKPYLDGVDLVDVAAQNEYGTSTIPARPFMKQSWDKSADSRKEVVKNAIAAVEMGKNMDTVLNQVGAYGKSLIEMEIINGDFVPNAPLTIKLKGSSRPLIDTGHMRQSVQYVIRERK